MKWVAKFYKTKNENIITNVWDSDQVTIPEGNYVQIETESVTDLNNAIIQGKKIRIKKSVNLDSVLSMDDFVVTNVPKVEIEKKKLTRMIQEEANQALTLVSAIDIFEYLELFVKFMEKGIFITEGNREEKYLEVINTGDRETIEALEQYLEIRDHVLQAGNVYKNTKKALDRAYKAKTLKELNIVFDEYKGGCA